MNLITDYRKAEPIIFCNVESTTLLHFVQLLKIGLIFINYDKKHIKNNFSIGDSRMLGKNFQR